MNLLNFTAVVLAAGRGKRFKATRRANKVMHLLAGRPMISYTLELLNKVGFKKVIIVVGFAKKSIINYFGNKYLYAEQKKRLGTGNAVKVALSKINRETKEILVINADDSAFYPPAMIKKMIKKHLASKADLTFLTLEMKKPRIARVIRDEKGNPLEIVEQQNLKPEQRKIKEINCGTYCFKVDFLKKNLRYLKKDKIGKEYYLTQLVKIGAEKGAKIITYKMSKEDYWQGINTREELEISNRKKLKLIKSG